MKKLINTKEEYIESIGKTLHVEEFDNGTEFYCLLDKYGNFNIMDTGRTQTEIQKRIDFWQDLVSKNVIRVI